MALVPLLALLAFAAPEGWWPPEGADPHPSALPEPVRQRVAATAVRLGPGLSGVFVRRDGLILTSATAARRCAPGPDLFVAADPKLAPECPGLEVELRIESRDVTAAVEAAQRAGDLGVEAALVTACTRLGPDRRCELVATEDGVRRLLVYRRVSKVRLRFFPGDVLGQLGGVKRDFDRPWLRLDVALLSVDLGRAGAPGHLSLAPKTPSDGERLWFAHHPEPSARFESAAEVLAWLELPRTERGSSPRIDAALRHLERLSGRLADDARRRELEVLARLRRLPEPRRRPLEAAFFVGRRAFEETSWPELSETWPALPPWRAERPPESARSFLDGADSRREAYRATSLAPIGPNGRGDLRLGHGFMAETSETFVRDWIDAARKLGREPDDAPPWPPELRLGFEMEADLGPLASGGPVLDERGELVGVVGAGDGSSLAGFFAHDPKARVGVASAHALDVLLRRLAPGLGFR